MIDPEIISGTEIILETADLADHRIEIEKKGVILRPDPPGIEIEIGIGIEITVEKIHLHQGIIRGVQEAQEAPGIIPGVQEGMNQKTDRPHLLKNRALMRQQLKMSTIK